MKVGVLKYFAWISKFYNYKISLTGLETWNNKIGKNGKIHIISSRLRNKHTITMLNSANQTEIP